MIYLTELHKQPFKDCTLILNVQSLDVFLFSNIMMSIIELDFPLKENDIINKLADKYSKEDLLNAIKELLESEILIKNKALHQHSSKTNKSDFLNKIDLYISSDCQLKCKYCFDRDSALKRQNMTLQTAKDSIDFLFKNSGESTNLHVCFFGGEPTIKHEIISQTIRYANQKALAGNKYIHYSITTNGLNLKDDVLDLIVSHKINTVISIDGDEITQMYNRPGKDNQNYYKELISNITNAQQKGVNISARATISKNSKNRVFENFIFLENLGFNEIHMEPAFGNTNGIFIDSIEDVESIKLELGKIEDYVKNKITSNENRSSFQLLTEPLSIILNKTKLTHSCHIAANYVAIDWDGSIYLCHRMISNDKYYLGKISSDFDFNKLHNYRQILNVNNRAKCSICWVRNICGGGCVAVCEEYNGNTDDHHPLDCLLHKHSISLALDIIANHMVNN
ncbi:MAG: SPASM domain-containing protein [Bacteroidales bacterium]|nr:MAG: SPASM domain-containing protein [Bacteroidales bacterium]